MPRALDTFPPLRPFTLGCLCPAHGIMATLSSDSEFDEPPPLTTRGKSAGRGRSASATRVAARESEPQLLLQPTSFSPRSGSRPETAMSRLSTRNQSGMMAPDFFVTLGNGLREREMKVSPLHRAAGEPPTARAPARILG